MDHSLEKLREEIDAIDNQIVALLEQRMAVARSIGEKKRQEGIPALDSVRFEAVKERLCARSAFDRAFIDELYEVIHKESLKQQ